MKSKAPTGPQKTAASRQARSASKARAELLAQVRALQAAAEQGRAVVAQATACLNEPDPAPSAKAAWRARTSKLNAAALRAKLTAFAHEHNDAVNALVDAHQATFKDLIKKI